MKIVFTGGGTAGHVMVNRILVPYIRSRDPECQILYIGSKNGMERELMMEFPEVPFWGIHTGKLRRYFSMENFKDIFRIWMGFWEALRILRRERPQLVYASGGYVTVPVVWAAGVLRIPVFLRETDYSVGLANRLCLPFAKKMFVTFPDTKERVKQTPVSFPGMIVRPELFDPAEGKELLPEDRPVCLVIGGSQGADRMNRVIWDSLDALLQNYHVIHICGKGNLNTSIPNTEYYRQIEFTGAIGPYLSAADVVISRCGSNAVSECLSLGKRMVCIPIPSRHSRGDQEQNAAFAVEHGNAVLLPQENLTAENLLAAISCVMKQEKRLGYAAEKHEMIQRIKRHAEEIWREAWKQFEKDLTMQARGHLRVNMPELSVYESAVLAEVMENCGIE